MVDSLHTQLDTRAETRRRLGPFRRNPPAAVIKVVVSLAVALFVALVPEYDGLEPAARGAFFILCFGAGLWMTEAIPAYAVALLVMALEIAILGRPGGIFATDAKDWELFIRPFGSPVIWLFFGGFVMAEGAARTGLDRRMASVLLRGFGTRPSVALLILMSVTFVFSMFISNTAATAAMIALVLPLLRTMDDDDPFAKALLLGVPFAANLGGMGTVIGSPPNAIAAGGLASVNPIGFAEWILVGLPPAVALFAVVWLFLRLRYRPRIRRLAVEALQDANGAAKLERPWHRPFVVLVFVATVLLWMSSPWHGLPTPVVSFLPITAFTVGGVLRSAEIRQLPWEVLLLLAGGLSLGVAVRETGLATWLVTHLPVEALGPAGVALLLAVVACALSNVMSNTAAANIFVPMGVALGAGDPHLVLPIALACSCAMCLPVSTPPNAIAYSAGKLRANDFLVGGLIVGVLGPALATLWTYFILR